MKKISMCRICLVEDVRMHSIVNTYLQDTYERLTAMPLKTADGRPLQVCYLCHARLRNCHHLQSRCLQSEELFSQVMDIHFKPTPLQRVDELSIVHPAVHWSYQCTTPRDVCDDVQTSDDNIPDDSAYPLDVACNVSVKVENDEAIEDYILDQEAESQYAEPQNINIDHVNLKNDVINYKLETIEVINEGNADGLTVEDDTGDSRTAEEQPLFTNVNTETVSTINHSPWSTQLRNKVSLTEVRVFSGDCDVGGPGAKKRKIAVVQDSIRTNLSKRSKIENEGIKSIVYKTQIVDKPNENIRIDSQLSLNSINNPYKCKVCDKSFSQKHILLKHSHIHTGEKPYKCDLCEKSFSLKYSLMKHIHAHGGDNPYRCDICEMCFSRKQDLVEHLHIHIGDKQYMCDICEKYFSSKIQLRMHNRIHFGKKPLKCNIM